MRTIRELPPNVRVLDLSLSNLDEAASQALVERLPSLRSLNLMSTHIPSKEVFDTPLPNLRCLAISPPIKRLECTSLRVLRLRCDGLSLDRLRSLLQGMPKLRQVFLSSLGLTDEERHQLARDLAPLRGFYLGLPLQRDKLRRQTLKNRVTRWALAHARFVRSK